VIAVRAALPDEFASPKQTEKNFALFYIACDTCALEIIRDRCSSATPSPQAYRSRL
jgi:hypothetical protein